MGSHGKSRKVHFFPELFEKTSLKVMPSHAKSWAVMVSRTKSAEFRGQRGGGLHSHAQLCKFLELKFVKKPSRCISVSATLTLKI
jgi:hypothetical protein